MTSQSAKAAKMIYATMSGNIADIGKILNTNPVLETARSSLIHGFADIKAAALDSGAYGCTIAGSGPAIIAITDDLHNAFIIRDSMLQATSNNDSKWLISPLGKKGAREIESIEDYTISSMHYHNFV